jgi:uncharacterized protein (TIGR01777 family)
MTLMRIVIGGGTGLIGRALSADLVREGYEVIILSRNPEAVKNRPEGARLVRWDAHTEEGWVEHLAGAHAIVNLAGQNISDHRWTQEFKQRILYSRVNAGHAVARALEKSRPRPQILVQASGIGYYGSCGDEEVNEDRAPGDDFLSRVGVQWEDSTKAVEALQVRRVVIRSAMVLSMDGGALRRFLKAYKFFVGAALGNGKQWLPWIHIDDEVRAIRFLLDHETLSGPFNLVAPKPLRNAQFSEILGRAAGSTALVSAPEFMLRMRYGEMVDTLTASQRAIPHRLLEAGFRFKFVDAQSALSDLLS